jgi:hypothetical protein
MVKREILPGLLLIILIFIETLCYTYLAQTPLYYTTSVLYFLTGFLICFWPFVFHGAVASISGKSSGFIRLAFGLIMCGVLIFSLPRWFRDIPIDPHLADMVSKWELRL